MNVSISYSPSSLSDFLAALEAVKGMNGKSVSVSPSSLNCPVSKYVEKTGASRYRRTPEGCQSGLSNLDDLKKRALLGDAIAAECLGEEIPESDSELSSEDNSPIEAIF